MYHSPLREKIYRFHARSRLKNYSFTIIANNCWAWSVYEDLGINYNTPTVGLFFYAPCYLKFVSDLKTYINFPLRFKKTSSYQLANLKRSRSQKQYPIGVLGDVEIHFLHYKNEAEAFEKWNRRIKRVNYDNLFVAFSDTDLCTIELIQRFDQLEYPNKVFFGSKNYENVHSLVWLKCYQNHERIGDISTNRWSYRKYFDVVKWLNGFKN